MRWLAVFLVTGLLTGCSSILGIEDFQIGDGGTGDGRDAMETGFCLGPTGYRICVPMEPTNAVAFNVAAQLDTNSNPQCVAQQPPSWKASGQPDACIVVAKTISISADVQWIGNRPLVLFASDSITIGATLDVASHSAIGGQPTSRGAGSSPTSPACMPASGAGQNSTSAAGGGGGGSFITKGGDGGTSTAGIMGGQAAAAAAQAPTILRAGCDGGKGGDAAAVGGTAGMGGGAVYLVAGNRITVNDTINASGSAGGGGGRFAGGGGAGSGGMILLHAPAIGGSGGVLIANGGGGGGGGGSNLNGAAGSDPVPDMPAMIPIGGTGNDGGGNGGNGFADGTAARNGNNGAAGANGAGGGGGGAGGYIRANLAVSIAASPSVSVVP